MTKFDMSKFNEPDVIDVLCAEASFSTREDFWVALTNLAVSAGQYLQGHTPSVVIFDPSMRQHFIVELEKVRSILDSLCVKRAALILDSLSEAIERNDTATLKDGLRVFHAEMKILTRVISDAIVYADKANIKKNSGIPLIVAIDDSVSALQVISNFLFDHYRLIALHNAKFVQKTFERHTPDLFIVDISMEELDGFQLVESIRKIERFSKTPVVYISGIEEGMSGEELSIRSGSAFLRKPLEKDLLLSTIAKYL